MLRASRACGSAPNHGNSPVHIATGSLQTSTMQLLGPHDSSPLIAAMPEQPSDSGAVHTHHFSPFRSSRVSNRDTMIYRSSSCCSSNSQYRSDIFGPTAVTYRGKARWMNIMHDARISLALKESCACIKFSHTLLPSRPSVQSNENFSTTMGGYLADSGQLASEAYHAARME